MDRWLGWWFLSLIGLVPPFAGATEVGLWRVDDWIVASYADEPGGVNHGSLLGSVSGTQNNLGGRGVVSPAGDLDGDGVSDSDDAFPENAAEWADIDADGIGDHADSDDDGDWLPDAWEDYYGLDSRDIRDAALDVDRDGLSALEELERGTSPIDADSDADGAPDGVEPFPADPTEWLDSDADSIGDNADPDDDNDGLPDIWDVQYGLDPFERTDPAGDSDVDGTAGL